MATTKLEDLINPQVMADMISGKIEKKIVVAPFAKVDTTLQGVAGNQITVPQYAYIGDAEDIAEGIAVGTTKLTASTTTATVKKAMKAVELTDEAMLSGYGNPVGEANNQLAKSIASKIDIDAMDAVLGAQLEFDGSTAVISYDQIVDSIDKFDEEINSEKVMFINPKQVATLRKDSNFISNEKYNNNVIMTGEIGMIGNARIVPSKKVPLVKYTLSTSGTTDALEVVADSTEAPTSSQVKLGTVQGYVWDATNKKIDASAVGDYVLAVTNNYYLNSIIKLNNDEETEDDAPAITIYLKRDTNVETERNTLSRKTDVSVDKMYTVALSNTSKVVRAKIKA